MRFVFWIIFFISLGSPCQEPSTPGQPWKIYQEWPFPAEEAKRRQEETAKALGVPVEKRLDLGNGVQMELVLIPAGRFVMGTAEPVEPDWKSLKWPIQKGQGILALGGLLILIFLVPVLWRSIRRRNWPQVSLGRMMLLFLSLSVAIMGGTGWWEGDRVLTLAQREFEAAKTRYADADEEETPAHPVTISKPFYIGKYEVTQEEWQQVMGSNQSKFKGLGLPMDTVSWDDTQKFLEKVKDLTGQAVRLPSEAEWEHSCRAGTASCFHSGETEMDLAGVGWYGGNSRISTHQVGRKKSNGWGLYDMHKNIWEWCQDWYGAYPKGEAKDPAGPTRGSCRVFRGGSWSIKSANLRSACRCRIAPNFRSHILGFRLFLDFR